MNNRNQSGNDQPGKKSKYDAKREPVKYEASYFEELTVSLNYIFSEHWIGLLVAGAGLACLLVPVLTFNLHWSTWLIIAAAMFAVLAVWANVRVRRSRASGAAVPPEVQEKFEQFRRSFEALAQRSKGLYHAMVEQQSSPTMEIIDNGMPPGLSVRPVNEFDNRFFVFKYHHPPGDPARPRKLTNAEASDLKPTNNYIRDKNGRALAIWDPMVVRSGFFYGDQEIIEPFVNIANAAESFLSSLPDEIVLRFPINIRSICRHQSGSVLRRYVFGTVAESDQPKQHFVQGWNPAGLAFDSGVVVEGIESPTGSDDGCARWVLLLHRLGWRSKRGSALLAARYNWVGTLSVEFSMAGRTMPGFVNAPEIPLTRFYSVIGKSISSSTDVCWASVWAIDRLLEMAAIPARAPISKDNPGRSFEVISRVGKWNAGDRFTEHEFREAVAAPTPNPMDDPVAAADDFYESHIERMTNSKAIRLVS